MYTDRSTGDFSLKTGSPALNAGDDGTNMGAWQGADPWWKGKIVFSEPTSIGFGNMSGNVINKYSFRNPVINLFELKSFVDEFDNALLFSNEGNFITDLKSGLYNTVTPGLYILKTIKNQIVNLKQFVIVR